MAAPNIADFTTMTGKTATVALSSTDATTIVNNAASSGKVLKVNSLYVANVDGTNACEVSVAVYSQDDIGGTAYKIASTIDVPANSTLVVITKDEPIYLEEDKSIGVQAETADDLVVVASYDEISEEIS
jgi:hypothetical protein